MNHRTWRLVLAAFAMVAVGGCGAQKVWTAKEVANIGMMDVPECAAVDQASGAVYVSNMQTPLGQYWSDDGQGFISLLRPGGAPVMYRWKESSPDAPLNEPKGMCLVKGVLYVADNTRVVGYAALGMEESPPRLFGPAGWRLNDMASDGEAAYVSDTEAGVVYRMDAKGVTRIKAPEGVNGITFFGARMFAVSWTLHDVYELDPSGQEEPIAFALAEHFKTPDGIEVLVDGTFLVSDLHGNRIVAISPDRRTVRTLVEVKTPADIGLDRTRNLLYVPKLEANEVAVYQLQQKKP